MVFEGLHSQTRHFNALNLTIQKTNYDKCLTVKNFTKQNLLFHYMSRNDEIEDLGFQDIFLALEVTYGIKFIQHQNRRHQCHHQARRSLLQEQLASFLLSGSPGQAPRLHRSGHWGQHGQAHLDFNFQ